MKNNALKMNILIIGVAYLLTSYTTATPTNNKVNLSKPFNLAGERSAKHNILKMESKQSLMDLMALEMDILHFDLLIKVVPSKLSGGLGNEYTCLRFTIQENDSAEIEIPALKDWIHNFTEIGVDTKGQVFGINHSKFENLKDRTW